jgi:hypothetical protein
MPYIEPLKRDACENDKPVPQTPGELNYAITSLCHRYIKAKGGISYTIGNEVIGVLACANMELYRVVLAPYEDVKRAENGPVSELDVPPEPEQIVTGAAPGVQDVTAAIIRVLEERLPPPAAAAPARRKKGADKPQDAPAAPPAEAPATSTTRRPARSVGVSPMAGVAAPAGVTVAPAEPERAPVAAPKLSPEAKRVSDVWAAAASGNGDEDI